jgi:hypothetical protein
MSFLIAAPQLLESAATDLANIGGMIGDANSAAAAATIGVLPAGADEVSATISGLFAAHGQAYRALSTQAALFHRQFVQMLNAGAGNYAVAEADATRLIAQA